MKVELCLFPAKRGNLTQSHQLHYLSQRSCGGNPGTPPARQRQCQRRLGAPGPGESRRGQGDSDKAGPSYAAATSGSIHLTCE